MVPFTVHTGRVASLPRPNVDTDQIVPKQFLKRVERTGFGSALFFDWRYLPDGSPNPGFALNWPEAAGASILLAGPNFGCGSSREHAAWALQEYGFRAILSASFADIFFSNCCQIGLLPVRLPDADMSTLLGRSERAANGYHLRVDLERRRVDDDEGFTGSFEIDSYRRTLMLRGLDPIGLTLLEEPRIAAFERRRVALGRAGGP